ncbi:MAG: methionyl-tRNA formyltransferase [Bacteroidota bacterium]|jgi:methionyl-tRNA formyltransferase
MIRLYTLGYKGFYALSALNNNQRKFVSEVVIAKDKSVQKDYFNETKDFCQQNNILFYERGKEEFSDAEYSIAIGWRWLINDNKKLLVFHDSLLPKYRGFNPLVTALIKGDLEIGLTALMASEEYDRGPIIAQKKIKIAYPIKINEAIERISELYAQLLIELIEKIDKNIISEISQKEEEATYSLWRDEEDYFINWNDSAQNIKRFIDSVGFPYNGAKTMVETIAVRIFDASAEEDVFIENRSPGKVIFKRENNFIITCGKGLLSVRDFYDDFGNRIDFSNKFRLRFK